MPLHPRPGPVVCLALAGMAAAQSPVLSARAAALPGLAPAPRLDELRAIADALAFAEDATERSAVVATLRELAARGAFYSPASTEPSFLWFQYERAVRRAEVRDAGGEPSALAQTLKHLVDRRAGILPMVGQLHGPGGAAAVRLHDLTAFGWHGAGEVLEAVADLAERQGPAASAAGAVLAEFLACEQPHPLTPHDEGAAGLAEPAPLDSPERRHPVRWGDGYRIALARAVLSTRPAGVDPEHATLHLLYSDRRTDRLAAIERLRAAALGEGAVTHLAAQLGDADRLVVREAIVTLGSGGNAARAAREPLQKLAAGGDKELRVLAERALARLGGR